MLRVDDCVGMWCTCLWPAVLPASLALCLQHNATQNCCAVHLHQTQLTLSTTRDADRQRFYNPQLTSAGASAASGAHREEDLEGVFELAGALRYGDVHGEPGEAELCQNNLRACGGVWITTYCQGSLRMAWSRETVWPVAAAMLWAHEKVARIEGQGRGRVQPGEEGGAHGGLFVEGKWVLLPAWRHRGLLHGGRRGIGGDLRDPRPEILMCVARVARRRQTADRLHRPGQLAGAQVGQPRRWARADECTDACMPCVCTHTGDAALGRFGGIARRVGAGRRSICMDRMQVGLHDPEMHDARGGGCDTGCNAAWVVNSEAAVLLYPNAHGKVRGRGRVPAAWVA